MENLTKREWYKKYMKLGWVFFGTETREKKVATKWAKYQTERPTNQEITNWLNSTIDNTAIVCGSISGIIVYDVDTKNGGDPTPFQNRGFYEVRTPSGGYHFYVKYTPILASTKHNKEYTGILKGVDIQSNSSVVFAPPSYFEGRGGYTLVNDVELIDTPDDLLGAILEALEPEREATDYTPYIGPKEPIMGRPGDIFNHFASWEDVLYPLGWTKCYTTQRGTTFWKRPGKQDEGISASTNWNNYDLFFAYTTSVDGLQTKKGYSKFNLFATLKFGGNYKEAAKALVLQNYNLIAQSI